MKHLAFLVFGGLLLAPLIGTASFDCERAGRADGETICADRALNDKDVEVNVKYHFLRGPFATGGRGAIRDRQQDWLRERRRCGGGADYLSRAHTQRISELDKQYAGINKPL